MASQDSSTPWGSGGSAVLRAESELCAVRLIPPSPVDCQSLTDVQGGSAGASRESKRPNRGGEYSATEDKVPLKVVCWNVAGINAGEIDTFLGVLDIELQWGVLILLELSAARSELHLSGVRQAGHLVSAQPFENGRRAGALVFTNACS